MLFFYIRHGDPIYVPDSLTELGKKQADAVAKRLAMYGIDRIFASTSERAIQTARPTSELTKIEIEQRDFCHERYAAKEFTALNSKGEPQWAFYNERIRQLFNSPEIRAMGENWAEHPEFVDTAFKTGIERVKKGADELFLSLGYEHDRENGCYRAVAPNNQRVALFAHQGFGIAFLSAVLDIPYPLYSSHFDMCHSGMTVIDFNEGENGIVIPKVLSLSNDSHLYKEGLPSNYLGLQKF